MHAIINQYSWQASVTGSFLYGDMLNEAESEAKYLSCPLVRNLNDLISTLQPVDQRGFMIP